MGSVHAELQGGHVHLLGFQRALPNQFTPPRCGRKTSLPWFPYRQATLASPLSGCHLTMTPHSLHMSTSRSLRSLPIVPRRTWAPMEGLIISWPAQLPLSSSSLPNNISPSRPYNEPYHLARHHLPWRKGIRQPASWSCYFKQLWSPVLPPHQTSSLDSFALGNLSHTNRFNFPLCSDIH